MGADTSSTLGPPPGRAVMMPGVMVAALIDRWRDMGPVLWSVDAVLGVGWLAVLAAFTVATEPRRVTPGARSLDLGGPEPPAVVNLITNDWELRHEAVPATLLDLAARRLLTIDQIGEQTLVRARANRDDRGLTEYERLVLDHVRELGSQTRDGFVPADALTTGPEANAKGWWRRFERAVVDDARRLGVSAPRWSAWARVVLVALAVVVAAATALAASTLDDDPNDPDDDPIGAALAFGGVTGGVLIAVTSKLGGERDTELGRAAAARWLGLGEHLGENQNFQSQPPAAPATGHRTMPSVSAPAPTSATSAG